MNIPSDSLAGQFALVTGAGSGIGRATAKLLGHSGARVALLGRTENELRATYQEMDGDGRGHRLLIADVADEESWHQAMEQIADWPRLDVVVANAGINGKWAPLDELEAEDWDQTLGVNLRGTFLTVRSCLPQLKVAGGSVIVVASVNGTRMFSNSGATAYACSKAAQVAFVKMTAVELARFQIRVNAVCPGAIETHIDDSTRQSAEPNELHLPVEFPEGTVPLTGGGSGSAGEVAELVWFLATPASRHVSGAEIFVDGAQSLLQG